MHKFTISETVVILEKLWIEDTIKKHNICANTNVTTNEEYKKIERFKNVLRGAIDAVESEYGDEYKYLTDAVKKEN